MKKSGFSATKRMLAKITPEIEAQFATANRENAELIVDVAKVLIPEISGNSRGQISNVAMEEGGQLVDFGPKAKVIEGGQAPRAFKNPAMKATHKKRRARNKMAVRDAIKAVS